MELQKQEDELGFLPALENPVILRHLFNCLEQSATFPDWKNVRLVCKLWHGETLARWRNTAVLSFTVDQCMLDTPLTGKVTARTFFNELQNPDSPYKLREVPYQRYKFEQMKIAFPHSAENPMASSFWHLVGPNIKHLTLYASFPWLNNLVARPNVIQFLVEVTPNLESVKLDGFLYDKGLATANLCHPKLKCLHFYDFFSADFSLSAFPNLQELYVENSCFLLLIGARADAALNLQQPLQQLGIPTIKRLDLMYSGIGDGDLFRTVIPQVRFSSLEHFSVYLLTQISNRYSDDDVRFLPTFVRNHRQTLKILEVFTSIDKKPPEVCPLGTRLPALTELRLWGNVVKSLGFLRFTPNLKLLHLDLYGEEKAEKMIKQLRRNANGPRNGIHVNTQIVRRTVESGELSGVVLQRLGYFQVNCLLCPEDVQNLAGWMPNLKTLKTAVIPETVSPICKYWPKLEHLACRFGSSLNDENVAGNLNKTEQKALVDLKYLKSFRFESDCENSQLTDASVANGFIKMVELTHLDICATTEFSSEAENLLLDQVQHVNVYRNHSNDMQNNWKCCINKSFHQRLHNEFG